MAKADVRENEKTCNSPPDAIGRFFFFREVCVMLLIQGLCGHTHAFALDSLCVHMTMPGPLKG